MKIQFTPEALADLESILDYYVDKASHTESRLVFTLDETLTLLSQFPQSCPVVKGDVRRLILRNFPYSIYYSLEKMEGLLVLAILHVKRNQGTIDERLG